jgi:hypothetical protein
MANGFTKTANVTSVGCRPFRMPQRYPALTASSGARDNVGLIDLLGIGDLANGGVLAALQHVARAERSSNRL